MGHRRKRKQERRDSQVRSGSAPSARRPDAWTTGFYGISEDELGTMLDSEQRRSAPPAPACGNCREFVPNEDAGRGECLHPGSGILMPWSDTPPCPFHHPRGRLGRER